MSEEIICNVLEILESLAIVTSDLILGDSSFAIILNLFSNQKETIRISALKLLTTMMKNSKVITLMIESDDFYFFVHDIQDSYLDSDLDVVKKKKIL